MGLLPLEGKIFGGAKILLGVGGVVGEGARKDFLTSRVLAEGLGYIFMFETRAIQILSVSP